MANTPLEIWQRILNEPKVRALLAEEYPLVGELEQMAQLENLTLTHLESQPLLITLQYEAHAQPAYFQAQPQFANGIINAKMLGWVDGKGNYQMLVLTPQRDLYVNLKVFGAPKTALEQVGPELATD
jgi:hypothetical protein